MRPRKLTSWELEASRLEFNLADGHANFSWPPAYERVNDRIGEIFQESLFGNQLVDERNFLEAASRLTLQSIPENVWLVPSASMSIEIVANSLRIMGCRTVALVNPTFDNLADILKRNGIELVPIEPVDLQQGNYAAIERADAVFVVWPNNPTGESITTGQYSALLIWLAEHRKTLVADFSFRLFAEGLLRFDQYKMAADCEVDWIFLEDTGKIFPTSELKVSQLSCSASHAQVVRDVVEDMFLHVSRFSLMLLTDLFSVGPVVPAVTLARRNYNELRRNLPDLVKVNAWSLGVALVDVSPLGKTGHQIVRELRGVGVGVLPAAPFYWFDSNEGAGRIRIAFVRDEALFDDALLRLVTVLN
jgi:aspartate/methionine/tyrosine aminotransferase